MASPAMPEGLREYFDKNVPGFWDYVRSLRTFLDKKLATTQDVTLTTAGKGIKIMSPNGTKYYVTVDDTGALTVTPE